MALVNVSYNVPYLSALSCLDDNSIFSPGLKAGMPRYGQLPQRNASPR